MSSEILNEIDALPKADGTFSLKQFSLNGSAKAMREQMLADVFVLGRIAILGQMMVIYAKPNCGKTLLTIWLLTEAIKNGTIEAEKVFYVNADDNYRGLTEKLELAEDHGFQMIAPGYNDFRAADFLAYLSQLTEDDNASGIIVILDTLKKFTDPMSKQATSDFGRVVRAFVARGGTVIMLAHTNKNRDAEGKVVFSGTSDIVDDADCAYTLDVTDNNDFTRTVIFENIKNRGDVAKSIAYRYEAEPESYRTLMESVEELTEAKAAQAKQQQQVAAMLGRNAEAIEAITDCIQSGITLKTEVIKAAIEGSGLSRAKIQKALRDHTGSSYKNGKRWIERKGEKAAKHLQLLNSIELSADAYKSASEGE